MTSLGTSPPLDLRIRALALRKNFAVLTVLLKSGTPMSHVMWVDADERHILINTELERAKTAAVGNNPLVSVVIWDLENPYRYGEVRGRVVEMDSSDAARTHIDELSRKYRGVPYDPAIIGSPRVIMHIEPETQRFVEISR